MDKIVKRYVPQNYIYPGFLDGLVLMSVMSALILSVLLVYPHESSGSDGGDMYEGPSLGQSLRSIERIIANHPVLPGSSRECQVLIEKLDRVQRGLGEYLYMDGERVGRRTEVVFLYELLPSVLSVKAAIQHGDSAEYARSIEALGGAYAGVRSADGDDSDPATRAGLVEPL